MTLLIVINISPMRRKKLNRFRNMFHCLLTVKTDVNESMKHVSEFAEFLILLISYSTLMPM